jgi:hypothetical protein
MLQDPLYWSQPKSLTFGAFGIVVGKGIILYTIKGQSREILNNIPQYLTREKNICH